MGCIFQSAWSSTETKNQKRIKLLYMFLLNELKKFVKKFIEIIVVAP